MRFINWIYVFLLPIFCSISNANQTFLGEDFPIHVSNEDNADRIYINLDRLVIQNEGMFLFLSERYVPVNALFCDNRGYYVKGESKDEYTLEECPNGHPSRHGDGRCNIRSCPYFRG